jgi:hypothetical protein
LLLPWLQVTKARLEKLVPILSNWEQTGRKMATLDPQKHTSMPEQACTLPETKYEVHIDELINAEF